MTGRVAACLLMSALAGCASGADVLVDRTKVDDAKYNRDMTDCKQGSGFSFSTQNPIARCMSEKGYTVLMGRSRLP